MTNPRFANGAPIWVDIGTTDVTGAVGFYTQLFGWTYLDYGPDSGGYGAFLKEGRQVAGIGPATDPQRGTSWSVYLATEDAAAAEAKVKEAGGTVVMAAMPVMGQGVMGVFTDTAGAFFSVWQPGRHGGVEV